MRGSVVCRLVSTPFWCPCAKYHTRRPLSNECSGGLAWPLRPTARSERPTRRPGEAEAPPRPKSGILAVAPLASGLTVRHLSLEQGIEGSNPSSPAKSQARIRPPEATPRALLLISHRREWQAMGYARGIGDICRRPGLKAPITSLPTTCLLVNVPRRWSVAPRGDIRN